MVVDTAGTYYFLEVNPTGQWAWLQDRLGFNISGAIADWLVQSPSEPT
jgi:glutathione synthase/RimK-type ligase-like ATP-grasp enzyme